MFVEEVNEMATEVIPPKSPCKLIRNEQVAGSNPAGGSGRDRVSGPFFHWAMSWAACRATLMPMATPILTWAN